MLTRDRLLECLNYDPASGIFSWKISRGKSSIGKLAGALKKLDGGSGEDSVNPGN